MRLSINRFLLVFIAASLVGIASAHAVDLSQGLMYATPAPKGPPALDGTDTGWDLSGAEPVWMSNQLAKQMHASLAMNYDDANLYVYARISLPNRKMYCPGGPADTYWGGDLLEMHLSSDPEMRPPLSMQNPKQLTSPRICGIMIWKNTLDGVNHVNIMSRGIYNTPGRVSLFDPPGCKLGVTEGHNEYVIQAALPWAALNVPDGKNPFAPGSRMTAIFNLHWRSSTWFYSVPAVYASNPGDFSFRNWGTWGQVEFSSTGNLKPHHGTMDEALVPQATAQVGVPITVDVPADGKLSLNIVGEHGEVIRDVLGGQPVKAGKYTAYWDGRDQWGFAQPLGNYHWSAYSSPGLKVRLVGFVGSSGQSPLSNR